MKRNGLTLVPTPARCQAPTVRRSYVSPSPMLLEFDLDSMVNVEHPTQSEFLSFCCTGQFCKDYEYIPRTTPVQTAIKKFPSSSFDFNFFVTKNGPYRDDVKYRQMLKCSKIAHTSISGLLGQVNRKACPHVTIFGV